MGEKETAREASAPSISERTSVQDFEKNTERLSSDEETNPAEGKAIIRNTDSTARVATGDVNQDGPSEIYQHNQSDLEFREASGDDDPAQAQRKDITVTIRNQKGED